MPKPNRSVVIPMFNEAACIASSLTSLAMSPLRNAEFLLVDDGSTDGSAKAASDALALLELAGSVISVPHLGKGAAVREGFAAATGQTVGFVDADLSTDVESVLTVFEAAESKNVDIAIANRRHRESVIDRPQPWYRTAAGRTFNTVLRALGLTIRLDTQCGLKAFTAEAAEAVLLPASTNGFAFDVDVMLRADQVAMSVVEVPVRWCHSDGSAVRLFKDFLPVARDLIRLRRRVGSV